MSRFAYIPKGCNPTLTSNEQKVQHVGEKRSQCTGREALKPPLTTVCPPSAREFNQNSASHLRAHLFCFPLGRLVYYRDERDSTHTSHPPPSRTQRDVNPFRRCSQVPRATAARNSCLCSAAHKFATRRCQLWIRRRHRREDAHPGEIHTCNYFSLAENARTRNFLEKI